MSQWFCLPFRDSLIPARLWWEEETKITYLWIVIFSAVLIWSGIDPKDPFIWFLETLPALIGAGILLATYKSFRLSPLLYVLILMHCVILMVGGHYTYAEVPLFDDLQALFGSERNDFDKLGHFAQGFVPALIAREILLRKHVVNGRSWLNLYIEPVAKFLFSRVTFLSK